MKNKQVCVNKRVGIVAVFAVVLVGAIFAMNYATSKKQTTGAKASFGCPSDTTFPVDNEDSQYNVKCQYPLTFDDGKILTIETTDKLSKKHISTCCYYPGSFEGLKCPEGSAPRQFCMPFDYRGKKVKRTTDGTMWPCCNVFWLQEDLYKMTPTPISSSELPTECAQYATQNKNDFLSFITCMIKAKKLETDAAGLALIPEACSSKVNPDYALPGPFLKCLEAERNKENDRLKDRAKTSGSSYIGYDTRPPAPNLTQIAEAKAIAEAKVAEIKAAIEKDYQKYCEDLGYKAMPKNTDGTKQTFETDYYNANCDGTPVWNGIYGKVGVGAKCFTKTGVCATTANCGLNGDKGCLRGCFNVEVPFKTCIDFYAKKTPPVDLTAADPAVADDKRCSGTCATGVEIGACAKGTKKRCKCTFGIYGSTMLTPKFVDDQSCT